MGKTYLSKSKFTIKANSTEVIDFFGEKPNHYFITNGGVSAIYLGVSMMPTEAFFDSKIPSGSAKMHIEPYGHDEIYIYNPSNNDANILITSFYDDFDATALALSGIGVDLANVEMSAEVDAKGELKDILNNINKYIPNNADIKTMLESIKSTIEANSTKCTKFYMEENTDAEQMYTFKYIELITNDSDTDMTFSISGTGRFTLKPNEVLSKISLDGVKTIKIPKNSSYRVIGG